MATLEALDALVREERTFSDRFTHEVRLIVGYYLTREAPLSEDRYHNTDLIVTGGRVGMRMRRHRYLKDYGEEFTIRLARPQGTKTELEKIEQGWGDYLFYGFANATETQLAAWTLVDLSVFKQHYKKAPYQEVWHPDQSALFGAYRWADFPREMFIAYHRQSHVAND